VQSQLDAVLAEVARLKHLVSDTAVSPTVLADLATEMHGLKEDAVSTRCVHGGAPSAAAV
jgi:hypothetical protein